MFTDRLNLLRYACHHARPGLALEFGVGDGTSLRALAEKREAVGFDSFDGLPEDWRDGFPHGMFAQRDLPDVGSASLVVGLFADTLPGWFATHDQDDIGLVHVDCDLYSSAALVLAHLTDLRPGTVLVFDELVGYPDWPEHEHRALLEWVAATGTRLAPLGCTDTEQAAFTIT